jgi:hypothetical protein
MLLFRGEEHVARWCSQWRMPPGAILSRHQAWSLAKPWFSANRGAPHWRRATVDDVESLFQALGLTTPFWQLR